MKQELLRLKERRKGSLAKLARKMLEKISEAFKRPDNCKV
jgi:hypothetical protein